MHEKGITQVPYAYTYTCLVVDDHRSGWHNLEGMHTDTLTQIASNDYLSQVVPDQT